MRSARSTASVERRAQRLARAGLLQAAEGGDDLGDQHRHVEALGQGQRFHARRLRLLRHRRSQPRIWACVASTLARSPLSPSGASATASAEMGQRVDGGLDDHQRPGVGAQHPRSPGRVGRRSDGSRSSCSRITAAARSGSPLALSASEALTVSLERSMSSAVAPGRVGEQLERLLEVVGGLVGSTDRERLVAGLDRGGQRGVEVHRLAGVAARARRRCRAPSRRPGPRRTGSAAGPARPGSRSS